jgi:hypothetical protein
MAGVEAMANGGTVHEREIASRKLSQLRSTLPAVRAEEVSDAWSTCGTLVRDRNGAKAYLRETALRYFLEHVSNGCVVTNRTVPLSDEFGSGDFYVILSWLLKHDLCIKMGSRYQISSKAAIVKKWNGFVDQMKV